MVDVLRLAIDGNEANVNQRVGSNIYAFELLSALEKITRDDPKVMVTVLLAQRAVPDMPPARHGWHYKVVTPVKLWTQFALPIHLFLHQAEYDVLFTPGHYAPRISSIPYVSSVMDVAYLKYPEQFKRSDVMQLTDWTGYSVKHAAKVITISQSTKRDVMKHYHRKGDDVVVAYPAADIPQLKYSPLKGKVYLKKLKITTPFILYVGTLQPRKNLIRLIEGFEQLCRKLASRQKDGTPVHLPHLVLAGKIGWLADDITARAKNSTFAELITLTGFISEEQKMMLYRQASCSVLIGLYEGFGIPPLESMLYGTIPVVSDTSSLPEVVGKAGILVDPENVNSISNGLMKALLLNAKDRAKYQLLGHRQLQHFNWDASAAIVLKTLTQVVS